MKEVHDISGWLIIDKPLGMGSTQVVGKLKHLLHPAKIGHAGTLDPLASGVLPIALGKATRTIEFVMGGMKEYEFAVTWGQQTQTDDAEGAVVAVSDKRPTQAAIEGVLGQFIGEIDQMPPAYSALKVGGRRAYELARSGQDVILKARRITVEWIRLLDEPVAGAVAVSRFRVRCSKGTYVRSLGRDLGVALGCLGFISELRRVICAPFDLMQAVSLEQVAAGDFSLIAPEVALRQVPVLLVDEGAAKRLSMGQRLNIHQTGRPVFEGNDGVAQAVCETRVVGLVRVARGVVHPYKMF